MPAFTAFLLFAQLIAASIILAGLQRERVMRQQVGMASNTQLSVARVLLYHYAHTISHIEESGSWALKCLQPHNATIICNAQECSLLINGATKEKARRKNAFKK